MNRWNEYLAATVRLDEVRRESAATVAAQRATVGATTAELTAVRQRISLQRTRLVEIATTAGRGVPSLEPLDVDRGAIVAVWPAIQPTSGEASPPGAAHGGRSIADVAADVTVALERARATLDAADATLSTVTDTTVQRGLLASRPPGVRNAIVYGWFALLALIAIIEINSIVGDSLQAAVVIAVFALIVPAGAWVLGWVTLRLLFGRAAATETSPIARRLGGDTAYRPSGGVVGALLCAVPVIVGLILSIV